MMEPFDNTTCEALRPLLLAHAAKEIGENETGRVREHLETCASCRAEYKALVRQLDALKVLRDTGQPSEIVIAQLKNQARNEIQSETTIKQGLRHVKTKPGRGWLPIAASFAVVCAVAFLILQLRINHIKINSDNNNKNQIKTAQHINQIGQKEDIDKRNTIIKDNNDKQIKERDKIVDYSLDAETEPPKVTVTSERGYGNQRVAGRKRAVMHHKKAGPAERSIQEQAAAAGFEDRDPLQDRIRSLKAEVDDFNAGPSLMTTSNGWDDVDARLNSVDSGIKTLNKRMRDMSMRLEAPPDQT